SEFVSNPIFEMGSNDDRRTAGNRLFDSVSSTVPSSDDFIDAPAFFYDIDFDLRALKASLKSGADFLEDSGYQSVLERSANARYGTGWMVAESMAIEDAAESDSQDDSWDGYIPVGTERFRVKDMSDLLATRFAFASGSRTDDGSPLVTFPDSHVILSADDFRILLTYIMAIPPNDESSNGFVIVADRRTDKWSSVRSLLVHISSFFPGTIRAALIVKPEGVLQRALEVGYRSINEGCNFKVILCDTVADLRRYLRPAWITVDLGGLIKYNHLEWVQHRMDIERMKSSASVIAQSLNEFGRCLKETEMPNDVETTSRILEMQIIEKDAIKEDFRIAVRKGLSLLRSVRQLEEKPDAAQLSPTRLHNVTAIECMLVQLEDTERSFDSFWDKHERRLMNCMQLRQFEDSFRKLQSTFARHMLYLEEHREVGDGVQKAEDLAAAHGDYCNEAQCDVEEARNLSAVTSTLTLMGGEGAEAAASILPKCDELGRMAEALAGALLRRSEVLRLSIQMHSQISQANAWCRRGVDLLSSLPIDNPPMSASSLVQKMDAFLEDGHNLELDTLSMSPSVNSLILLTTTETTTLLAQVAERIDDIRRLSVARRDALMKAVDAKPVLVVSPEKMSKKRSSACQLSPFLIRPPPSLSPSLFPSLSDSAPFSLSPVLSLSLFLHLTMASTLKRSIPRFLSFRLPKKRLLKSISAPLIDPIDMNTVVDDDSIDEGIAVEEPRESDMTCDEGGSASSSSCCIMDAVSPSTSTASATMEECVIHELVSTERSYVSELESIIEHYLLPLERQDLQAQLHPSLRGRSELIFGNLREIVSLHSRFVLPDLLAAGSSPSMVSRAILAHRHLFVDLYTKYCQHKQANDGLRKQLSDSSSLLLDCQRRAGHLLPLSAYLLKPVQRITKYQLLLRELERHCRPEARDSVSEAHRQMLELLAQINAAINNLHISGFNGDFRLLGTLRLQTEADVFTFSRKKSARRPMRAQRRHIFLFDGGVLFCKKRNSLPAVEQHEYYEHKLCIPMVSLGFSEHCRQLASSTRFELWDSSKADGYSIEPVDAKERLRWVDRMGGDDHRSQRPKSWTSVLSTESCSSSSGGSGVETPSAVDRNGNKAEMECGQSSTDCRLSPDEIRPLPISVSAEQLVNT
ncbi:hypothetical protein PFISCL1PPCAC_24129, partial [Pristionchus fissidentatus]